MGSRSVAAEDWASLRLNWTQPEPVKTAAGMKIGNGHLGANLKGGVPVETIELNDKTFWSGGPEDRRDPARRQALAKTRAALAAGDISTAEAESKKMSGPSESGVYLPIGKLVLSFDGHDSFTDYSRTLSLDAATATVRYASNGVTYTRQSFASHPDDVIVTRITASRPGAIALNVALQYPPEMDGHGAKVAVQDDTLVMTSVAPSLSDRANAKNDRWDGRGMRAVTCVRVQHTGGKLNARGGRLNVAGADEVVLIQSGATSYNGPEKWPGAEGVDPLPHAQAAVAAAATKSFDALLEAHQADTRQLFRRVWVDLNGETSNAYALGFQYARYEMIAVSRTGDRPHNQQGMWNHDWRPDSFCSHFLNENVEKYYGLIESANLAELGNPLWNWMDELAKSGARTAKVDFGFRGWMAPHYSDIWASTTLKGTNPEWAIWPMGGVWLCNNLYDHYLFSGDESFLRQRAYPLMKGAAEFCLDYLVEDTNGRLVPSPSTSPENRYTLPDGTSLAIDPGTTINRALVRSLLRRVADASLKLNIDADFRQSVEAVLPRLAPYEVGADGMLREWSGDYGLGKGKAYTPHRHASHVIAVWPLAEITADSPALFAAAKKSLDARGQGGFHPDKGAMYAWLHDGDKALAANDSFYIGADALTGKWPPKYAGFPELFLQSHAGAIELLPALPSTFTSGTIRGLRARGGFEVDLQWADRRLQKAVIHSVSGRKALVRYNGQTRSIDISPGQTLTVDGQLN